MDAAGQIFYSLGIGFGSLSLFATGNKASNSFYEDALVCALGNGMTSLWASIILFSFFGFKIHYHMEKCQEAGYDPENVSVALAGLNTSSSSSRLECNRSVILDQVKLKRLHYFFVSRFRFSYQTLFN